MFLASDFSGWIWHSQGQNGTSMNKCADVIEKWKQLQYDNQRKVKDLVPGLPVSAESLFRWPPDNLSQREGTRTYYGVYSLDFVSCQMQEWSIQDAFVLYHFYISLDLGLDLRCCSGRRNMELRKSIWNVNKWEARNLCLKTSFIT